MATLGSFVAMLTMKMNHVGKVGKAEARAISRLPKIGILTTIHFLVQ